MKTYNIEVILDSLHCRDTESIHSSDKFALAGAVFTDIHTEGTILPIMRINDGEHRTLKRVLFNNKSHNPIVGINLQAWDIDENDSWVDNEEDIKKISSAIAQGIKLIPKYGTIAGFILDGVNELVPEIVNGIIKFDNNDQLLNYSKWIEISIPENEKFHQKKLQIGFKREDWTGYSSFDYTIELTINCTLIESTGTFPTSTNLSNQEKAMHMFRHYAVTASNLRFVGGYPNFHKAHIGFNHYGGGIFFSSKSSEWQDVKLRELKNPDLENFGERMRATHDYAVKNGFVGGFPNFFHAKIQVVTTEKRKKSYVTVCGTILLKKESAVWKDIPLTTLGNPPLDDIESRFRATNDYAIANNFIAGFPNFYHADYGQGVVCGTILIKPGQGEWKDILLSQDPK